MNPIFDIEWLLGLKPHRYEDSAPVKLTEEEIKQKHDEFHEIYREQLNDTAQFSELRKEFNSRKKLRETDMATLDNCILRGEEVRQQSFYRIPAYKLAEFHREPGMEGMSFIIDSNGLIVSRVEMSVLERQLQLEYPNGSDEAELIEAE